MSTYNIEAMRKKLNDTWAATIIDIADKDFENTQFVGVSMLLLLWFRLSEVPYS